MVLLSKELRISEIFYSIQGESTRVGLPSIFIRLTGCPLRCHYCDTSYAFRGGELLTIEAICQQLKQYPTQYITVTGGEPLAQKECQELLTTLCDLGYQVSLETSGAFDVAEVDTRVMKVVDIKTPGSGEVAKNLWSNMDYLSSTDQLKFVICDQNDFLWSQEIIAQKKLEGKCEILFSPSHAQLSSELLADWLLSSGIKARLQLQIHKYIWGDVRGK